MSYALLWIEVLIVLLLWVAAAGAVLSHIRYRFIAAVALFIAWLWPLAVLGGLTWMTAAMKFWSNISENWFGYTLSLLVGYVIGIIVILAIGRRREAPGLARASAEWPRGRLALAFLVAFTLATMTLWNMDLEVRGEAAAVRTEAGALLLAVVPPQLPDEQNAATLYEKAFARLKATASGSQRFSGATAVHTTIASMLRAAIGANTAASHRTENASCEPRVKFRFISGRIWEMKERRVLNHDREPRRMHPASAEVLCLQSGDDSKTSYSSAHEALGSG